MWFSVNIPSRWSILKHWGRGDLIFNLATDLPLLKYSKIPFALFIGTSNLGTSNLHSV